MGWNDGATGHLIDYGRLEVASEDLGVEAALLAMLREFRDLVTTGWPKQRTETAEAVSVVPHQVWVDAGYMTPVVYTFCREAGGRFRPVVGRGASQQRAQYYNRPTQTGSVVKQIGEGYHANWLASEKLHLYECDSDHWKSWVHQRLSTPLGTPGAMSLFKAGPQEHLALARHLTAEIQTEQFIAGKGMVVKWERLRRQNHWLDALYNACAAGHLCGARLVREQRPTPPPQPASNPEPFVPGAAFDAWARDWAAKPRRSGQWP